MEMKWIFLEHFKMKDIEKATFVIGIFTFINADLTDYRLPILIRLKRG